MKRVLNAMVDLHLVFFSFFSNTFLDIRTDVLPKTSAQNYCIFSIKRPRRLFQTWHGGLGVSLNKQFIWARHFLRKGHYSFFLVAVYLALKY